MLEKREGPSFSMKGGSKRTDMATNTAGPGPGKYGKIEDKPRGPNARITGRHPEKKVPLADQMRGNSLLLCSTLFFLSRSDVNRM